MSKTAHYSVDSPGKRIRPALVILVSKALGYSGPMLIPSASAVEMAHAATLVHDDMVDNSKLRRGVSSTKYKFGTEVSILTGDYLFAKAFQIMSKLEDIKLLEILSDIAIQMCEGEVFHFTKKGDINISEEEYFEIIKRKTANFISACCEIGCRLGRSDERTQKAFVNYGLYLGMAFQIIDDILNLTGDENITGKPRGSDLFEGKYSLPVIQLKKVASCPLPVSSAEEIIRLCREFKSFEYAKDVAIRFADQAKEEISIFNASDEINALLLLVDNVIERQY